LLCFVLRLDFVNFATFLFDGAGRSVRKADSGGGDKVQANTAASTKSKNKSIARNWDFKELIDVQAVVPIMLEVQEADLSVVNVALTTSPWLKVALTSSLWLNVALASSLWLNETLVDHKQQ
jgi:hypothetical protein